MRFQAKQAARNDNRLLLPARRSDFERLAAASPWTVGAMNYLAHIFLSHETPDAITGAMLGDFVKGRVPDSWSTGVRNAILLHRALDRYTDAHPAVGASRALISPQRRRFAGILVDVFYDHFLARDWARYHDQPLAEFTGRVYRVLWPRRRLLPERLRQILPAMTRDDWLAAYADLSAVDAALGGIARRFRYPARAQVLAGAVTELERQYQPLERYFHAFFAEARAFAQRPAGAGGASAISQAAPARAR